MREPSLAKVMVYALSACLVAPVWLVRADAAFAEPRVGSADRRALLDAIRPRVETSYRQKVKFSVRALMSNGSYALAFLEPLDVQGAIIGPKTLAAEGGRTLQLDGWVFALFKKVSGKWRVLDTDLLQSEDKLDEWQEHYPAIPSVVFDTVGMATNTEG